MRKDDEVRNHQWMLKLGRGSLIKIIMIRLSSHKLFINYKGNNINFGGKKAGIHHYFFFSVFKLK